LVWVFFFTIHLFPADSGFRIAGGRSLEPGDAPGILSRACIFTSPITVVYSLGLRVNTCVAVYKKLLSRAGVRSGSEVGGDHGGVQAVGGLDGGGNCLGGLVVPGGDHWVNGRGQAQHCPL
jgi:hypothetical protein